MRSFHFDLEKHKISCFNTYLFPFKPAQISFVSTFTPGSALIQTLDPEEHDKFWSISCFCSRDVKRDVRDQRRDASDKNHRHSSINLGKKTLKVFLE